MLLQVKQLNKAYTQGKGRPLIIFKDLDFHLNSADKITTIFGPSGIGKTTFLNILGTVDTPDSGEIILKDISYSKENYQRIRKDYISYMFQFHYLLPEFTIYENIDLTLKIKKRKNSSQDNKGKIISLLEEFNIENKINCYPSELSGGEKQRVSLARAIISNPLVVLADEPTGNLDLENSKNIINKIQKISSEKDIRFIIASHDKRFQDISDSVVEINNHGLVKKII
tara:strand:+ start:909 stop:1589 length:681 start_codon:yes stop_codon:yes gene_type:complete